MTDKPPTGNPFMTRRNLLFASAVVALVAGAIVASILIDGSDDVSPSSTTAPNGAVALPQNPSLALMLDGDTWFVENDGNVTMSEIVVRDDSDAVLCDVGALAPDERAACEAADAGDDISVFGLGPQGQAVDVDSN